MSFTAAAREQRRDSDAAVRRERSSELHSSSTKSSGAKRKNSDGGSSAGAGGSSKRRAVAGGDAESSSGASSGHGARGAAQRGASDKPVELNVGGRFFTCSVGVLKVVKNSWLDGKFGGFDGRWEDKHVMDSAGRVFLDFDGDLFAVVLSQLRARFYNPNHKFEVWGVAPERMPEFESMLDFMNLLEEFGLDPKSKALAEEAEEASEENEEELSEEAAEEDMQDMDPVSLNVGGVKLTVALDTLRFPFDSDLSDMFNDGFEANPDLVRDEHGRIFLDYDGDLFAIVISYLRLCKERGAEGTEMTRTLGVRAPFDEGCIPRGKAAAFDALLETLGLHHFVHFNGGIAEEGEAHDGHSLAELHMRRVRNFNRRARQ